MDHPPVPRTPQDRLAAALDTALQSLWRAQGLAEQIGNLGLEDDLSGLALEVARLQSDICLGRYRRSGTRSRSPLRSAA